MRPILLLAMVAGLAITAGCRAEPDFDERFEQQSQALSDRARRIENESRAQLNAAREAERAAAELRDEPVAPAARAGR
jgi:glutamate-1-semialdehyde aminotransferase